MGSNGMHRASGRVLLGAALGMVVASSPGVVGAEDHDVRDDRVRLFRGAVHARLLSDSELEALRGASLYSVCSLERAAKRRVVLWDEAHSAEITLPGAGDADNVVTTSGEGRSTDLLR